MKTILQTINESSDEYSVEKIATTLAIAIRRCELPTEVEQFTNDLLEELDKNFEHYRQNTRFGDRDNLEYFINTIKKDKRKYSNHF